MAADPMSFESTRIQAAVVVQWPNRVPLVAAREMSRRLIDQNIPATWSLDQVSQIEALASWGAIRGGAEAALLLDTATPELLDERTAGQELSRRLELLRSTGMGVEIIQAGPDMVGGSWPRTLRAQGVIGVVVNASSDSGPARALPFGVWVFTPRKVVPQLTRWADMIRRPRPLLAAGPKNPAVVNIDLARAGMPESRPWRQAELAIAQIGQAIRDGVAKLETLGQITSRLCQANAPRPQRSILRAAA
jgi:hypothetical protein